MQLSQLVWREGRNLFEEMKTQLLRRASEARAVVLTKHGHPGRVTQIESVKIADPKAGEVQVKMIAAPIHPKDITEIKGNYGKPFDNVDRILGTEGVGEVVQAPSGALNKGDKVVILPTGNRGTWATVNNFLEEDIVPIKAADADLPSYGAIGMNGVSGMYLLGGLTSSDVVIQNGGNGAMGQWVAQIANKKDIATINVVRKSHPDYKEVAKHLKQLAGKHGIVISDEDLESYESNKVLDGVEVTRGLNCVGGRAVATMAKVLAPGSELITYGGMSNQPILIPTSSLLFNNLTLSGFWLRTAAAKDKNLFMKYVSEILSMAEKKEVQVQTEPVAFADFEKGMQRALSHHRQGKINILF